MTNGVICAVCGGRKVNDTIKMSNATIKRYVKCSCSPKTTRTREILESDYQKFQRLLRESEG